MCIRDSSGAALARESGRPVVPVAHNAGDYWPRRGLRKRRGTVRVVFGPPIPTEGKTAKEINLEAQRWVESTMARISDSYPAEGQEPEARAGTGSEHSDRETAA